MRYERPDVERFETGIDNLLESFRSGSRVEKLRAVEGINLRRRNFETMGTLAYIRYTLNTEDLFYEGEKNFFDRIGPRYEKKVSDYYRELLNARDLEEDLGKQIFTIAELTLKTISSEVIDDMKEENLLSTRYTKLLASAKFVFKGRELTLSGMSALTQSTDREVRRKASHEVSRFFEQNVGSFDDIYDGLVRIRTRIAGKLGFDDFIQLAYARMQRSDYGPVDVKRLRGRILKEIVPQTLDIREKQRESLGLDRLCYYDESLWFNEGNPKPRVSGEALIEEGLKMYGEFSRETGELFSLMVDNSLINWENRRGKSQGGYTTFIDDYRVPFIFANFNGTRGDVNVLTHEFGHSLNAYLSRDYALPEYRSPTLEACEIHSMGMEFLIYPWTDRLFDSGERYRRCHGNGAMVFLPYASAVDEFQHRVYENWEAEPTERRGMWREIEQKYMPYRNYEDDPFLDGGGFWYRQRHIFESPFYYIDYAIAQLCALELADIASENRDRALESYFTLCRSGGSKPFADLVKAGGLSFKI